MRRRARAVPVPTRRKTKRAALALLRLDVQCEVQAVSLPDTRVLKRWARAALGPARRPTVINLRIVGRRESAMLNRRYRHKAGATNVLSFPPGPIAAPLSARFLGDIVICAPVVKAEAASQGKAERAHWAHMLVHGILHLRGYDHVTPPQATLMEALETRVLRRLGFPNPYATDR